MLDLILQHRREIEAICRRHRVRTLELFGSARSARFDSLRSDVDFLYEFDGGYSPDLADRFFGLAEDLERLLGRKVDLVSSRDLRDTAFLNAIQPQRLVLYAA